MKKKILLLITVGLMGCSGSKYIKEVPFKLTYDQAYIENYLRLHDDKVNDTIVDEYEEKLTDKQIYVKEKYAIVLQVKPKEIKNYAFYQYIDEWLDTPYAIKGFAKDSLNIVPFAQALYNKAYQKSLPKSSLDIFKSDQIELFTGRAYLQEGDLIFFRYNKDNPVSDIAIYLRNDKILMSTRKTGLAIANFNDDYFQLRYIASGRIKPKKPKKSKEDVDEAP